MFLQYSKKILSRTEDISKGKLYYWKNVELDMEALNYIKK